MWYDIAGFIGVATLLGGYTLLQMGRIPGNGVAYPALNLIGSLAIMISLVKDWNASAFVLEAVWALVSIYGIIKGLKARHSGQKQ